MGSIIGLLVAKGLSEKAARAIAYVGLGLGILLLLWGAKCAYDNSVIKNHEQKIERRAAPATNKASDERARDTINNEKSEEELHNAVHSVPDAAPAGPSHALACKRLSNAGKHPASCGGPASGR